MALGKALRINSSTEVLIGELALLHANCPASCM